MKILKIIGLLLLIIVAVFLIAGLIYDKEISADKEVVINRNKTEV